MLFKNQIMLKSGKKRARKEMRSLKYRKKAYEINKKEFILGALVSLKSNSKLTLIQSHTYYVSFSGDESIVIHYRFSDRSSNPWQEGFIAKDQRMCFKISRVIYDDDRMEISIRLKGVADLMSYKDFKILKKPKRRRLI